jgi:hypothetical protein
VSGFDLTGQELAAIDALDPASEAARARLCAAGLSIGP